MEGGGVNYGVRWVPVTCADPPVPGPYVAVGLGKWNSLMQLSGSYKRCNRTLFTRSGVPVIVNGSSHGCRRAGWSRLVPAGGVPRGWLPSARGVGAAGASIGMRGLRGSEWDPCSGIPAVRLQGP